MSIKNYTEEFKIEAVKQVIERGYSQADVARRLGVNRKTMCEWVKRYGEESSHYEADRAQEAEIRRLQRELKRVTEERDILKEAAAFFANESRKDTRS